MRTKDETDGEDKPIDEFGINYWQNWKSSAREASSPHHQATKSAWIEYLGDYRMGTSREVSRSSKDFRFPVFWASIQTVQPEFYSSTPIPIVEAEFGAEDPVANTASTIAERAAKYFIKTNPFDRVEMSTRDDYLLGDKATNRVLYEEENVGEPERIALTQTGDGIFVDGEGQQVGEGTEIGKDKAGSFYLKQNYEPCVKLVPVSIYDILHTPYARHWDEIDALAFRIYLTKSEAAEKFGKNEAAQLAYGKRKSSEEESDSAIKTVDNVAEILEVWDKKKKQVFYLSDKVDHFLKPVDLTDKDMTEDGKIADPYGLPGFYPCPPFILGTVGPDNMYPTTTFTQLEDVIRQMHQGYKRLCQTGKSTQRRGIFDGNIPELAQLNLQTIEGEFIPVKNFKELVGDGGLDNLVKYFPVGELASAMTEMIGYVTVFKQYFDELYGVTDTLRGMSDPDETATAQTIKIKSSSRRFRSKQRAFQELVRKDIELGVDLMFSQLDDQLISEIVGLQFMKPEDQTHFAEALSLLRTDKWRTIRINIQTDSTILPDEEADSRRRNEVVSTLTTALSEIGQLQLPPPLMQFFGKLMIYAVEGMRDAKSVISELEAALAAAQAPAPEQPPPPDYEAMKLELQSMKINQDGLIKQREMANDLTIQLQKLALERDKLMLEIETASAEALNKDARLMLERSIADLDAQIALSKAEMDQRYTALDEREKWMTERRLQFEAQLAAQELMLKSRPEPQAPPNITVVHEAPKPVKKRYSTRRDAMGNMETDVELIPEGTD